MKKKKSIKHLISLGDVSRDELEEILYLSKNIKLKPHSKNTFLKGKSIALIFAKPSLRTRVSFEVGINELGGHPITLKMDEISIGSREDEEDISRVLSRYVHGITIRTFHQEQIINMAKHSNVPIINALSDEEHPCQIIADLFTIKENFGKLNGLKIAYVGDGNNVVHSMLIGAALAGADISVASPKGYQPSKKFTLIAQKINPKINIEIITDPNEAVKNAHVIYTDVWASMGQEKEFEDRKIIFKPYQVNKKLLKNANKNAIVLHCLPAHKGQEITKEIFERFSDVIIDQAENRLHAQKAIILSLLK